MNRSEAGKLGALVSAKYQAKQRQKRIEEYTKNPKCCKYCGKPLPYDKRMNTFCDLSCFASFSNSNRKAQHYCKYCGKLLKKTQNYCSNKCQNEHIHKQYIQRWQQGQETGMCGKWDLSGHIKRYIRSKFGEKCASCGCSLINPYTNKSILEIHHIDGDYTNNQESNLILLCPNCHAMTPNYKFIGSRKGRSKSIL